jgi:hypothetical protein
MAQMTPSASAFQHLTGVGGGGRNRRDDAAWLLLSQGLYGSSHRGSGRQPVIHQNDGPAGDIRRRAIAAIEPIAPRQLPQLARHDRVDFMFRNSETAHDFIVQNADTAGCDRAHCQLLVPRNAQLAHQKNIERRAERTSHFTTDGYPAARQGRASWLAGPCRDRAV